VEQAVMPVASKVTLLEMTAYAKPIIAGGLQREMNVLAAFSSRMASRPERVDAGRNDR
jgi:hypothetical protein